MVTNEVRTYPIEWEAEYRANGVVASWPRVYPDLFRWSLAVPKHPGQLSSRLGTLDLFAQYALQYLLRRDDCVESLTWYKLGNTSPPAASRDRTEDHWKRMRKVMGGDFTILQNAVIAAGLKNFSGEPDLFCWNPRGGHPFFAEAKRRDHLGHKQLKWFDVCSKALGDRAGICVCQLVPGR